MILRHVLRNGKKRWKKYITIGEDYIKEGVINIDQWIDNISYVTALLFDHRSKPFQVKFCGEWYLFHKSNHEFLK